MPENAHVFRFRTTFDLPVEDLFAWHSRPGTFERLCPPWQSIRVVESHGGIENGASMRFNLGFGPIKVPWLARMKGYELNRCFIDEQVEGPFRSWEHRHAFFYEGDDRSTLEDEIFYALPGGKLDRLLAGYVERGTLVRMFAFRHDRTRRDIEFHRKYKDLGRLRVAVTGASGLIGSALCAFLESGGHEVLRLVRRTPRKGELRWDPEAQTVDAQGLEGLDAVVHLAGENVGQRWTDSVKKRVMESRVLGTRLLARTLPKLERPPGVWISGSAVGYYGACGDEWVEEESPLGKGFLAQVCEAWEAESHRAQDQGLRVVNPRIGIVLSGQGGALTRMLPAFKAGAGGPMGEGKAWMPWIALDDVLRGIVHCIHARELRGPVNLVGPEPVRNRDFAKALGRVLDRPSFISTPAAALRMLMGEMADEALLSGQRASPRRLVESGFEFGFSRLEDVLRFELGV